MHFRTDDRIAATERPAAVAGPTPLTVLSDHNAGGGALHFFGHFPHFFQLGFHQLRLRPKRTAQVVRQAAYSCSDAGGL